MFRRGDRRGARQSRRRGGGAPVDPNLAVLLNLPGLLAFFDPDWLDGLTLRESGGTQYVTAMLDRTEQHVLAQPTEAAQPVWGALSPTGRRGMTFDGSNDFLLESGTAVGAAVSGGAPFTLLIVKKRFAGSGMCALSFGNTGNGHRIMLYDRTVSMIVTEAHLRTDAEGTTDSFAATEGALLNHTAVCTHVYSGTTVTTRVNGNVIVNGASNTRAPVTNKIAIGALWRQGGITNQWSGEVHGVLVLAGALAGETLAQAEAAAMAYYGIGEAA